MYITKQFFKYYLQYKEKLEFVISLVLIIVTNW